MLNQKAKSKAFTIVELLTVISVITLIIGLLVPALNKVNRIAKDMKQRAQFHSINTALEMFKSENGDYPASTASAYSGSDIICGAQKLAEALVGRDLQGYDQRGNVNNPDDTGAPDYPYGIGGDQSQIQQSLDRRKGPYLNADNLPIFDIAQVYAVGATPTGNVYPGAYDSLGSSVGGNAAPVITDIYKTVKVSLPNSNKGVNAGTPVLYYKSNIDKQFNDMGDPKNNSIYNIYDNDEIVKLGTIKDGRPASAAEVKHRIDVQYNNIGTGIENFYTMIENSTASVSIKATDPDMSRPYRPDSYILISAGYDGIYGTNDDVTNYED